MVITCAFCAEIYQLHRLLVDDSDLDTFALLKEIPRNSKTLEHFTRDDFGEIYLFFDYDGHSTLASDNALAEMLALFKEETDLGKLFVSYPMVESIKHCSKGIDFKTVKVVAKKNIRYKELVANEADNVYLQYSKYTFEIWQELISLHLKKMNFIVSDQYSTPEINYAQTVVFINQRSKFIDKEGTVAVLSGFPMFLFDYFGRKLFYVKL